MPPFVSTYPATVDTAITLGEVANNAATALSASLSNVAVTASVTSTALFPSTGALSINDEIIYYTGKTGTTFTGLIRGQNGTAAAAHASGDTVEQRVIAAYHQVLSAALIATQTELGTKITQADTDALYSVLAHTHSFASLTSKPTTIAGYGITDFNSLGDARWSLLAHTHAFADLTSKPTTIGGYGITDFNSLGDARWALIAHVHAAADITSGILGSAFGGTGNGFTKFSGPASTEKTFTLPNASATILTDNAAVSIAQGGTGQATAANAINALLPTQTGHSGEYLTTDGSVASWATVSASDDTKLPLAGGTMTGTITSTMGTVTVDTPVLSATQTWNDSGVTFNAIFVNVTSTASAAASKLIDLQVGGSTKFSVNRSGDSILLGEARITGGVTAQTSIYMTAGFSTYYAGMDSSGVRIAGDKKLAWTSTTQAYDGFDTGLARNAAGVVEVNNGTAGTFRDILVRSILIDGAPSTAGAGQIAIGADTRTTIGANGGASALTALPAGYIDIDVGGSPKQIAYYERGA